MLSKDLRQGGQMKSKRQTTIAKRTRERVDEIRVAGGMDDDVAAPAPRAAGVLEHRQQQQVLEPHHGKRRPSPDGIDRARLEDTRLLGDLEVPRHVPRLWDLRLRPLVVL